MACLGFAHDSSWEGPVLDNSFYEKHACANLKQKNPPSLSLISNVKDVDNAIPLNDFPPLQSCRTEHSSLHNVRNELLGILNELRFITHKIKEDSDAADETNDWKFAAMVIDRLCFWIFTVYLTVATLSIFFSAPNMFKSWAIGYSYSFLCILFQIIEYCPHKSYCIRIREQVVT